MPPESEERMKPNGPGGLGNPDDDGRTRMTPSEALAIFEAECKRQYDLGIMPKPAKAMAKVLHIVEAEVKERYTDDAERMSDMGERPTIHTIPVPDGWSPEQAWEAIKRGDLPLPEPPQGWANIETVAGYYVRLHPPETPLCPNCGGSNIDSDTGDGECPKCRGQL
jgi:hypothetical protein